MGSMKTPGVYIIEKNAFPNSVVEAPTAIPAFIGYTERAVNGNDDLTNVPWKISSMTEYIQYFGGGPDLKFEVDIKDGSLCIEGKNSYTLYYNMMLFFANGGGACYIVSVGSYKDALKKDSMITGLGKLTLEQEITLVAIPEAVNLSSSEEFKDIQQQMLSHCGNTMKNRFALLDIYPKANEKTKIEDQVNFFCDNIGSSFLSYGAAYFPWLNTSIVGERDLKGDMFTWTDNAYIRRTQLDAGFAEIVESLFVEEFEIKEDVVKNGHTFKLEEVVEGDIYADSDTEKTKVIGRIESIKDIKEAETGKVIKKDVKVVWLFSSFTEEFEIEGSVLKDNHTFKLEEVVEGDIYADSDTEKTNVIGRIESIKDIKEAGNEKVIKKNVKVVWLFPNNVDKQALHQALYNVSSVYKQAIKGVLKNLNLFPPSAAMAGIYTMVDNSRGVWKAPANVTLNYVGSTVEDIDDEQQAELNVPIHGKAVNVIRLFRGEGIKVWGARTLDGNSLDWRYVNVRRTLLFLEESIKNAARAYVFEPNDAGTWINMKCMIDSFLRSVWKRGGLAGATPEDAFEVHIGLGDTMTAEDILDGIMRITVLVAVTHPAEFIEITFQQQAQKS
ncbi:phage tail sheath family protein [Bacteroides cellulosilyticus]|uniref:phage tail sheath family protein n=1 Tax=Bacteroides cellulosilyticus TaxID=246787 RepID=UPI0020CB25CD|nr:phage tail sheath C-terminal domain-containing protein [Bacteroides cellulosilyticus]